AERMGVTLAQTAYSVNIKERLDFSCALFDTAGAPLPHPPPPPGHPRAPGGNGRGIAPGNARRGRAGAASVLNDPYHGGTHLPDITVVTPVFDEAGGTILFYVACRGHHADIGGITPGSMPPDSSHLDEEGVLITNFQLVAQGRFCESEMRALLTGARYPTRDAEQNLADLRAMVAANQKGVTELKRMVEHFGLDVVRAYMQHVQDNAEESVRRVIDVLKDGSFEYPMDNGAVIRVKIAIDAR